MKWYLAMLALALLPGAASAQETATPWPPKDLEKAGSIVFVRDDTGSETSGTFLRFDPDAIVLLVDDVERRFEADRVRRIDKRGDSLRDGAITGGLMGVLLGGLAWGMADCPGDDPGGSCPVARAGGLLLSAGFLAAIGAGIDKMRAGRTTVYEAPAARLRPTWALHGRQFGINLTVKW